MPISAEEWQLLSLFEVEPQLLYPGEPWFCNDAVYRVIQGDISLTVSIAPMARDVSVTLEVQRKPIYEFTALGVLDVRYITEDHDEALEIVLNERQRILLRISPHIKIRHLNRGEVSER